MKFWIAFSTTSLVAILLFLIIAGSNVELPQYDPSELIQLFRSGEIKKGDDFEKFPNLKSRASSSAADSNGSFTVVQYRSKKKILLVWFHQSEIYEARALDLETGEEQVFFTDCDLSARYQAALRNSAEQSRANQALQTTSGTPSEI